MNAGRSIKNQLIIDHSCIGKALGWKALTTMIAVERKTAGQDMHPTLNENFLSLKSLSIKIFYMSRCNVFNLIYDISGHLSCNKCPCTTVDSPSCNISPLRFARLSIAVLVVRENDFLSCYFEDRVKIMTSFNLHSSYE